MTTPSDAGPSDPDRPGQGSTGRTVQLRLALPPPSRTGSGLAGLIRTRANASVLARLEAVAAWRDPWLLVLGPPWCGLSEMSWRFADDADLIHVAGHALTRLNRQQISQLSEVGVVIDDAHHIDDGSTLLQVLNACRENQRVCALFSHELPSAWGIGPDDLRSRLKGMDSVEVLRPDPIMLEARLIAALREKFILLNPELARYIAARIPASYPFIAEAALRLDHAVGASGRGLSVALVRQVLAEWPDVAAGEEGDNGDLFG